MSQTPDLSNLSPDEKRKLLAKLLKDKAESRFDVLSYGQRALWLLHRLEPGQRLVQRALDVAGPVRR